MAVNRDKPDRWKADIARSVDMYNNWFMEFAPQAFRETRIQTTQDVENTLEATDNLTNVQPKVLRRNPGVLPTLRMSTCPPLARDRLIGLADVPKSLVERMEREHKLPVRLTGAKLDRELRKIGVIIEKMADRDIFTWLDSGRNPTKTVNISVDAIIMRRMAQPEDLPLLVEAKSAGDFTNVNKRRKEEAKKMEQLRRTYGEKVEYVLFLCGYFDSGYLGYEAAEGIDWVWEHRIDDLTEFGMYL